MRYLHTIHSNTTAFVRDYFATVREAFTDINTFIDQHLESELVSTICISIIIAAPIVGGMIFLTVLATI